MPKTQKVSDCAKVSKTKLKLKLNGELNQGTNPTGNLYVTQDKNLAYIGSVGAINVFDLKTRDRVLSITVPGFAPKVQFVTLKKYPLMLVLASSLVLLYDNTNPLKPVLITQLDLGLSTLVNLVANRDDPTVWYVLASLGVATVQIEDRKSPLGYNLVLKNSHLLASFTDADLFADVRGNYLYVAPVVHRTLYIFSIQDDKFKPVLIQSIVNELVPNNLSQSNINPNILIVSGQFGFAFYDVSKPNKPQLISQQETKAVNNGLAQVPESDLFVNAAYSIHSPLTLYRLENYASYPKKKISFDIVSTVIVTPGRAPWDARPILDESGQFVEILSTNSSEESVQVIRVK